MFIFKVQLLRKCFSFLFLRILGIFRGGLQKKDRFYESIPKLSAK